MTVLYVNYVVPKRGVSWLDEGPQMWDNDLVEAGGPGDETIHLRQ